ncbi:hypothetical protein K443DRAFT_4857 [Laccaria amethystina LaAM-08-1]|uniref:Uncharacterized protein n=1 Tax=Laccaria amethystina LaAM-08-1 TaxID=1095629 RepID=A0A0C9WWX3_9AGAR|nr:hypothetical protein K443DRAFT_4857 [Laccaria amethystina LaAM-08-1]
MSSLNGSRHGRISLGSLLLGLRTYSSPSETNHASSLTTMPTLAAHGEGARSLREAPW